MAGDILTKTTISPSENPIRRQASLGGNVVTRSTTGAYDNGLLFFATVAKVYYQKGTLDFKVTSSSNIVTSAYNNNGVGSAPIPVDFYGTNSNGKVFGHYRPIKTGEKVLLGYIDGYSGTPVVLGVYPDTQANYELISPVSYNTADDTQEYVQETTLGEKKVYPNQQILYEAGTGELARSMNGHSFMYVSKDLTGYLADVNYAYEQVGSFRNSDGALVEPENDLAGAWLLVHEDNPTASDGDTHRTRFYVDNKGNFQVVFMDTEDTENIAILEGSKDGGFTLTKRFDQSDLTQDSSNYVTLNLGDSTNQSFKVEAASEADSKSQSSSLEVKSDGVYVDGKSLEEYISTSTTVTGEDIDNALPDSTYFKELQEETQQAGKDAQAAADAAQQAGDNATEAGLQAEQAGEDAKAQAADIKNRIIYYTSISPEKDVYVPGKYLIINTDTYIADGTINNAYIENGAIDHAKIASEAVGSSQIEDLAVTRAKIANLAVGTAQIENLAVTDEKVGTLSFNHMIGETLDADHINVINLHGDNITAGTITADKLIINGLGDITSNLGMVTSGEIVAGDGTDGVNVSGLDADNPDEYTPYKKSLLKAQIAVLEAQADAAIVYGKDTGNDYTSVQAALDNLLDGTASLLSDMTVTTEFDHNTITSLETALQTAISNFQTNVNSDLNRQIGLTADGKNKITYGTEEPSDPSDNDIWIEKNADGTSQIKVYTSDSGWISPVDYNVQAVAKQVSSLPQNYYQTDQPTGTDYNDGSHWYQQTGTDSNGNPIYTTYLWNSSTKTWDKMLNSGEVDNASQITQVKSDLSQAASNISQAQSDITQAQSDIKTNASAISDNKGNISSLTSTASRLSSDMADAQGNISTLQNTASGFTNTVATLQTQVNNSAVGTNLLENTGIDYKPNFWSESSDSTYSVNDGVVTVSSKGKSVFSSTQQGMPLNAGDNVALSVDIKGTGNIMSGYYNGDTYESDSQLQVVNSPDAWERIVFYRTLTSVDSQKAQSFTVDAENGSEVQIRRPKVEKGDHATDWSPNPADNATVTSVSSLTNTVSGLSSTVSDNSGNISTLQTRANNFDVSVGQLQTSAAGIQLLVGTATPASIVGDNISNQCANTYVLAGDMNAYDLYQKYGDTFTLSFDWSAVDTANAYTGRMQQQFNDTPWQIGTEVYISSSNTSGHVVTTFTLANDSTNIATGFQFRLDNVPTTSTVTVSNMKLEKGSLATAWCLSPMEQLTSTNSYAGLSINSSGLTEVAGSTTVYLSNTNGFEIQKSGSDIFHVDTSGSLTMQGNITAGNISGVNFTGDSLTLSGTLSVTGSLSADNGNVVINSGGLTIKGAGLTIGDSSGNTTTYIKSDGTFVTSDGDFSGSVAITDSLTLSGSSANINVGGGQFYVDSSGNVTANSFTSTSSQITNSSIGQSTITIHNSDNSFNATLGEISTDYWGFHLYSSGNQTWIDYNGIHNTDNNGTDTYIKNGTISTNIIDAQSKLHIGNSSSDPRDIWGTDIDVNGLSFGVPVKKNGATTNNASDYETEIQGYINGQGWNYKTTTINGTGYSGIAIGLATQQTWGAPYGGDFIGIGQFVPTSDIPNSSSGNIGSAQFDPAIAYWATSFGNAYGADTVSIEPPLYLGDGHIKTLSGDITLTSSNNINLGPKTVTWLNQNNYSHNTVNNTVIIGTNGAQWIQFEDKYVDTTDNTHLANIHAWEVQYGSLVSTSKLSLKKDIEMVDIEAMSTKIYSIDLASFRYKNQLISKKKTIGGIIDDVNEKKKYTLPEEFISDSGEGTSDHNLIGGLIATVQSQAKHISNLELKVAEIEAKLNQIVSK